jgi:hypothetical protein
MTSTTSRSHRAKILERIELLLLLLLHGAEERKEEEKEMER